MGADALVRMLRMALILWRRSRQAHGSRIHHDLEICQVTQ
jgi:hypothetical protein